MFECPKKVTTIFYPFYFVEFHDYIFNYISNNKVCQYRGVPRE